jgi:prepilin-type N-terminal cleavage/methylation domain-containing protein
MKDEHEKRLFDAGTNFALNKNKEQESVAMALDRKRNKKDKGRHNGRGFTLMELIITMAILTIVALIAVPSFQRIAINGNLRTAARDIASDFALYKQRAIAESCMYRISLNVAGNSYQLQQCNNTGSPCGGWTTIQNKNLSGYATDIIFDAGTAPANYDFQTRGTVNMGTVILRNSRNSTATLTTNITGRINVQFIIQ